MDSAVRKLVGRLDEHLGRMSSQMEELHESVRQVVVVAEADPEMALTKARKVLESVLRRVWEHFLPNEPVGTRPLEEILQRLQKNGHLPRKQAAYAFSVKELGNVGTHVHDEKVDKADVVLALSPLISVLEWYFEQDWAVGASSTNPRDPTATPPLNPAREDVTPGPRPAPRPRYLVPTAAAVMVTLSIVAGWLVMTRDKAVPPTAEAAEPTARRAPGPDEGRVQGRRQADDTAEAVEPTAKRAPRPDEDRVQGRWQVVDVVSPPGGLPKRKNGNAAPEASRTIWTFRGGQLTISNLDGGEEQVKFQGAFSLSTGVERKMFDYATTGPNGQPIAFTGIYEFDGDFLKVCHGIRLDPANQPPESRRPDSFLASNVGFRRSSLKFRRVGE